MGVFIIASILAYLSVFFSWQFFLIFFKENYPVKTWQRLISIHLFDIIRDLSISNC